MTLRPLAVGLLVAASMSLGGCASSKAPEQVAEAEVTSFEATPLATRLRVDDVCDAYASTLASEVEAARAANPDVVRVSQPGTVAFAGRHMTLRGSLEWLFQNGTQTSIEVAEITRTLLAAVRPVVEAAVGDDGFVQPSKVDGKVPAEFAWSVADAWFDVAMREAKAPTGIDLKKLFENHRGEWDYEFVLLPQVVSRKPTGAELREMFALDDDVTISGEEARTSIREQFDMVSLDGVDTAPGIKERWFLGVDYGDSADVYAIFMDEHDQVWGFRQNFQVD
jgi:hypothetical protein